MVLPEQEHKMFHRQVHACGDESWGDDKAYKLYFEACRVPWVLMEHDSAAVADDFADAAKDEGNHIAPRTPTDTDY